MKPENLLKTSAEMFVIYKYFSDPLLKVKSTKYTQGEFRQFKDIFPAHNLLEVSPLTLQLMQTSMAAAGVIGALAATNFNINS